MDMETTEGITLLTTIAKFGNGAVGESSFAGNVQLGLVCSVELVGSIGADEFEAGDSGENKEHPLVLSIKITSDSAVRIYLIFFGILSVGYYNTAPLYRQKFLFDL